MIGSKKTMGKKHMDKTEESRGIQILKILPLTKIAHENAFRLNSLVMFTSSDNSVS